MAQLLKDAKFYECCRALKLSGQNPNDPDRRAIEKAFRRLALRTHPDKVQFEISSNYLYELLIFNPNAIMKSIRLRFEHLFVGWRSRRVSSGQ